MRDGQKEIWEQAIRLARALDNASAAGNNEAAKMHGAALLEVKGTARALRRLGIHHLLRLPLLSPRSLCLTCCRSVM